MYLKMGCTLLEIVKGRTCCFLLSRNEHEVLRLSLASEFGSFTYSVEWNSTGTEERRGPARGWK